MRLKFGSLIFFMYLCTLFREYDFFWRPKTEASCYGDGEVAQLVRAHDS